MLKALVIYPNEKTKELGDILQVARSCVKQVERTEKRVLVKSIIFDPVTKVYVAIYKVDVQKLSRGRRGVIGR